MKPNTFQHQSQTNSLYYSLTHTHTLCSILFSDINGAQSTLNQMATDSYLVDEYTLRDLTQFYARHNNMDGVNRTLAQCKAEHPDEYSWTLVLCIKELAATNQTHDIHRLLPLLRESGGVEWAIENSIARFVESGVSAIMPEIFAAVNINIVKFSKFLMIEMVHQAVPAKELHRTWTNLNAIGITISSHFDVYRAGVRSQSMLLIYAVLQHMHANGMEIKSDDFKGVIQLSAKNGIASMLRTIKELRQLYGFKPPLTFIRDRILTEFPWKNDPSKAIEQLCSAGLSARSCVLSIVNAFLIDKNIEQALNIAKQRLFYLDDEIIVMPLIDAYVVSGDTDNFVRFIRLISDSIGIISSNKQSNDTISVEDIRRKQRDFVEDVIQLTLSDRRLSRQMAKTFLISLVDDAKFLISREFFELIVEAEMIDHEDIILLRKLMRDVNSTQTI